MSRRSYSRDDVAGNSEIDREGRDATGASGPSVARSGSRWPRYGLPRSELSSPTIAPFLCWAWAQACGGGGQEAVRNADPEGLVWSLTCC